MLFNASIRIFQLFDCVYLYTRVHLLYTHYLDSLEGRTQEKVFPFPLKFFFVVKQTLTKVCDLNTDCVGGGRKPPNLVKFIKMYMDMHAVCCMRLRQAHLQMKKFLRYPSGMNTVNFTVELNKSAGTM